MPAFDPDADLEDQRDWALLSSGFVHLYWRPVLLAETSRWLVDKGYRVVSLDASEWATAADFHRDVAEGLEFPAYYGRNLDALNDCLSDVVAYSYGSRREAAGTALVLLRFDAFAARQPETAQAILDIFAGQARTAALVGHRMLCLVQSDDPNLEFSPVGATPVSWNPQEWLNANRRA